ncbi:gyf domain-containing mpd2 [Zalerion maritima]|uniref:Gyf domain-containing mpd2 n=1 Tax=Zalerion maritima TaxID=339359 RepID=A0AAD5RW52_9PEZI|nr:gyf domain-containing mpd2 [Zalerion maritima]
MMPSNISFASAAAGQNSTRDGRSNSRSDTRGSSDLTRRDGRPSNGTLTFRRSSTTPFLAAQASNQPVADHIPPTPDVPSSASQQAYDVPMSSTTYSREQLLQIYRSTEGNLGDVDRLFMSGWTPGHSNGVHSSRWTKPSDHAPQEPDLCWDPSGSANPLGLQEMSDTEREIFLSGVNSTMKPPQLKDGIHPGGLNGRKASLSHSTSNFGLASPSSATRPGTRRRETTDTNPFSAGGLTSPSTSRPFGNRDDPSVWPRNRADTKDLTIDESDDNPNPPDQQGQPPQSASKSAFPFPGLGRSNTTGNGIMTTASIWGASPTSATTPQAAIGTFGNFALPGSNVPEKPPFARQGSRFASIIGNKDSSENMRQEPSGMGDAGKSWRPRPRTDTDPFGAEEGGGNPQGDSPRVPQGGSSLETPSKASAADFGMSGLNIGGHDGNTPLSPSETNPYRSPAAGEEEGMHEKQHHGNDASSGYGTFPRSFAPGAIEGSDRSQTSSAGPAKGFGGFGGGALAGGWPSGGNVGTPDRERQFSAFGSSLFGPAMSDIHSPSMGAGLGGGVFGPSAPNSGSLRGSKLGSLFPAAMQAQMQPQDHDPQSLGDSIADNPTGSLGRSAAAAFGRESDSPMRGGRSVFDLFGAPELAKQAPIGTQAPGAPGTVAAQESGAAPGSNTDDTPPTQVRQMVMPDRMRWVYLDPQGNTQGPFTGLEMNDWYKGNFFSADLRIKKLEDADFEPLGHLIRRIGNSREPFLVPQVGIPHGPPTQGYNPGSAAAGVVPPLPNAFPQFGRVLPADEQNNLERRKQEEQLKMARQRDFFAQQQAMSKAGMGGMAGGLQHHSSAHSLQSQPSFGSISSPVGVPTQAPIGAGMPPSSAVAPTTNDFFGMPHTGAPQPPAQPGIGGSSLNMFLDETAGPLTLDERQILANIQASNVNRAPGLQQTASATGLGETQLSSLQAQAEIGLRSQLPSTDQLEDDTQGFSARLREFEQYQAQNEAEALRSANSPSQSLAESQPLASVPSDPTPPTIIPTVESTQERKKAKKAESQSGRPRQPTSAEEQLSLTQQVQKAQAAKQSAQEQPVWAKPDTSGMPMPFPPPAQTGTPLPAPTAQRTPSTLPDQFANRSQSETPDNAPQSATSQAPPPLAPWAPETIKSRKGPNLKEIQEAEARKAAKRDEAAAAQRRLALEQEAATLREREKAAAAGAGLPTSSTWGHSSPVGGTSTNVVPSAWATPGAAKSVITQTESSISKKKTLAEIQREEEARKRKEMASQTGASTTSGGKLYAHLSNKTEQPTAPLAAAQSTASGSGAGWTTVSASGKPKPPPTGPAVARTVSATKQTAAAPKPAPKAAPRETKSDTVNAAMDEFKKWVERELKRGNITSNISDMTNTVMGMPTDDATLISDIIYMSSTTMDGRHFAEEFIRRKKQAQKGVVEKSAPVADTAKSSSGGGWNEVAKKGGHSKGETGGGSDMMQNANFKVVTGRKKGSKK